MVYTQLDNRQWTTYIWLADILPINRQMAIWLADILPIDILLVDNLPTDILLQTIEQTFGWQTF
jgi:hypothetical protein